MKQTIKISENFSNKLREGVSSDLKGYVEVDVKNIKTGEIEHTENHNLIVYGGREWLLKKMFGELISDNEKATKGIIKWVGFGSGGGEPGNPLQTGSTVGSDDDLYQPIRIRFDSENVLTQKGSYASRILSDGSIVPGYFKKISSVTLKEDHANPYVQDNVTKYPSLIAELRIELSSDDCNGVNYTDDGKLIPYQDINEIALFIADPDVDDPGQSAEYDELYLDLNNSTSKTFIPGIVHDNDVTYNTTTRIRTVEAPIEDNAWRFQIQITNKASGILEWKDVDEYAVPFNNSYSDPDDETKWKSLMVKEVTTDDGTGRILNYSIDGGLSWDDNINGHWKYTFLEDESIATNAIRLYPCGKYLIEFENKVPDADPTSVYYELQYRNYYNDPWKVIKGEMFDSTGKTGYITLYCESVDGVSGGNRYSLSDCTRLSMFRVKETTNTEGDVTINSMEPDSVSYDVRCYVSQSEVSKLKVGNLVYTPVTSEFGDNSIPQSSPLLITEVYNPEVVSPETATSHTPYFVIERQGSVSATYTPGKIMKTYSPSKEKPYTMFSRVCISSLRKSAEREIVIVYKIYV